MKPTKYFNITVPELGDKPDITQVSNAISNLEDALAGTTELMEGTVNNKVLTLVSSTRTTKRTSYHKGMSVLFIAKATIDAGGVTSVKIDDLAPQSATINFRVDIGETAMLYYDGSKFLFQYMPIPKSTSVSSTSISTVATSSAAKQAYDKGVEALNKANTMTPNGGYDGTGQQLKNDIDTKVSKSGDIMTGKLNVRNNIEVLGGGNNFIAPNNYGYMGRLKDGSADYMLYMDTLDRVRLGFGARRVLIQDGSVAIADGSRIYHQGFRPTTTDIGAEPAFSKKTGFNLDKTDSTENDSNKLFSAKGALSLFNTLTTNFTNGINAAKESLRLDIVKKVSKSGDTMSGSLIVEGNVEVRGGITNFVAPNNYGYMGRTVEGVADYMLYMNADNEVNLGYGGRQVYITGPTKFNQNPLVKNTYPGITFQHSDGTSNAIGVFEGSETVRVHKGKQRGEVYTTGFKPSASDVGAVSKSGDTMSAALRFNSNHMIAYKDTYKGVYASAENIGFTTSENDWAFYIDSANNSRASGEIYANKTQKVYHPGNKPSASDINALPISGGYIKGDLGANRFVGENNFGFMNKKSDGTLVYSLLISTANKLHLGWANSIPIYVDSNSVEFNGGFTANADLNINAGSIKLVGGGKIYSNHTDLVSYKNTRKGVYASDLNVGLTDEGSNWLLRCDNDKNIYDGNGKKILTSGNTGFSKELLFSGVLTKGNPGTLTKAITDFDLIYVYGGDNEDSCPFIYLPENMMAGTGASRLFQCNYADSNGGVTNTLDYDTSYFRMKTANVIEFIYGFTNNRYIPDITGGRVNIVGIKFKFGTV